MAKTTHTTPLSFAAVIAACRKESAYPIESHRKSHQAVWAAVRSMSDDEIFARAGGEPTYTKTVVKMAKTFLALNPGATVTLAPVAPVATESLGDKIARLTAELTAAVEMEAVEQDSETDAAYGQTETLALPAPSETEAAE
jgi:hypothetical protein